jgi:hypothetical protein
MPDRLDHAPARAEPAGEAPWGLALVSALSFAAAALLTRGFAWVPPRAEVLAGAVLVAWAGVHAARRRGPAAAALGAVAMGAAAGHLLLFPGAPRAHDLPVHAWSLWAYGRCVREGGVYPSWVPDLGAGMPLLQFYGPLNFLAALPGIAAGLPPVPALKAVFLQAHVLSALSMLLALRVLGAAWPAALVGAGALAFAPWRLAVTGYRGALGEADAFVFAPLAIASALRVARAPSLRCSVLLVASLAGLALTHPLSLFTTAIAVLPALLLQEWRLPASGAPRAPRYAALAASVGSAAALTAAWWIPIAVESRHTALHARTVESRQFRFDDNGAGAGALVERRLWSQPELAVPESVSAEARMPFYVGLVLTSLALAAPLWARGASTAPLVAGCALALVCSTRFAAPLLAGLPGFSALQFPWRFLSPAAVMGALAVGLGFDGLERAGRAALWPALAIALLVWDAAPFTGAADRIPPYEGLVHWSLRPGVSPNWSHWEEALAAHPVAAGAGDRLRVAGLRLPPTSYETAIASFRPSPPEWLTPPLYAVWDANTPEALARVAVRYRFTTGEIEPLVLPALPFAGLGSAGTERAIDESAVRRRGGRIDVRVDGQGPGRLTVREQAFPGWQARVDGVDTPLRDEDGFLAVDVGPGRHDVELLFRMTRARRLGLGVTLLSLAGAGGIVWRRRAA